MREEAAPMPPGYHSRLIDYTTGMYNWQMQSTITAGATLRSAAALATQAAGFSGRQRNPVPLAWLSGGSMIELQQLQQLQG